MAKEEEGVEKNAGDFMPVAGGDTIPRGVIRKHPLPPIPDSLDGEALHLARLYAIYPSLGRGPSEVTGMNEQEVRDGIARANEALGIRLVSAPKIRFGPHRPPDPGRLVSEDAEISFGGGVSARSLGLLPPGLLALVPDGLDSLGEDARYLATLYVLHQDTLGRNPKEVLKMSEEEVREETRRARAALGIRPFLKTEL